MLNYTVTSSALTAASGSQVDLSSPTVVLTITANSGYTVVAADFSIGDALPSEVTSAVFTDTGSGTVECTITFAPTFIMPAADVSLPIDIDGQARAIDYNTAGTLIITGTNINPDSTSTPYSLDSVPGEVENILFYVYADAGYHFETVPDLSFSASSNPNDYSVFSATPTTDIDGNVINYSYNIRYIRSGIGAITGDEIKVLANAVEIFVPTNKYFSYTVPAGFGTQTAAGIYSTNPGDKQLLLSVYGDVGAAVTIDISKNGAVATNVVTAEAITFEGGYSKILIPMTGAIATDYYDITFSGDIDPSFVQPNPLRINIVADLTYTINVAPIAGYTITNTGITSVSGPQGYVVDGNKLNTSINGVFKITKDDGATIALRLFPTWQGDVSNLDYATNGGTEILYNKGITVTGNGTTELFVAVTATINEFGASSVTSTLTLSTELNAVPITTDVAASTGVGETVAISLTGEATDADGDTMTPIIVTQPTNGTVVVNGFGFTYTHTADTTYPDAFTYKVSDGYSESNESTVNITVTGNDPATLTPDGGAGLYRTNVDVGATASTIDVTFDSGLTPGRIKLIYDGVVVADTLFIGDNLTDANRAATVSDIEQTHQLYQFEWVGDFGNGPLYGQGAQWNVTKPIASVTYDSTDIASTGNVRTTQANWDGQSGIQTAVGVDSADGNAVISYTKPVGGAESILVYVEGIAGSAWNITDITVTVIA